MYDELWKDPHFDNAWRNKLDALGYSHKAIDLYKMEAECSMCGRGAYLFPLNGYFECCERCWNRFSNYNNIVFQKKLSIRLRGNKCHLCNDYTFRYIHVSYGRFCSQCYWRKLGKKNIRLKDDLGNRVG